MAFYIQVSVCSYCSWCDSKENRGSTFKSRVSCSALHQEPQLGKTCT